MKKGSFEINLTDSTADLSDCRRRTLDAAIKMGFSEKDAWDIVAAVFEACINALTHGCKSSNGPVILRIHTDSDHLKAVITDCGEGFDCPTEASMPPASSTRGRGIPMMMTLMDEVNFHVGSGCSVTMIKYFNRNS